MLLLSTSDLMGQKSSTDFVLIHKLVEEFYSIFSDNISDKYKNCPITISVILRFFPKETKFKTVRRYNRNENILNFDFIFKTEEFIDLLNVERRYKISHEIYNYLSDTFLKKYKIPNLDVNNFLDDISLAMKNIGWLANDIDYSLLEEGEF
jgi:hypothetical protein